MTEHKESIVKQTTGQYIPPENNKKSFNNVEDGEVKTKKDKNARKQKKQRKFTKKSFLCPVCGRDFKDKPGKYEHMRNRRNKTCEAEFFSCECPGFQKVNSNGKPYGRNFLRRKYIHMKVIHMGFLGCVSPNCLQVFEKEEDLANHTNKVHHKEEEFQSKYMYVVNVAKILINF